ncbi:fimbrial protein [Escherichia coli]|nr:fimbrial protein [Escherichia coli]EFI1483178.1 fimbrial protein [Escherichia coli]EIQ0790924.1 fimbrial protein [Escherichia coli]EIQ2012753.1 fimbrial protein [Escherichia coli]EJH1098307.1 fimbrial protein [Escherichia coli]
MSKSTFLHILISSIILVALIQSSAWATCSNTRVGQTEDGRSALIEFGKINLTDTYFAPVGSLLATTVVPSTNYTSGGASGSSVLWECDATDLPNIYFLVATNGDDRVGGFHNAGGPDALSDVYATWFAFVGLKQTMAGVTIGRYWKKVPITSYATQGTKIQIRLQDIPALHAELYRISTLPDTAGATSYCGNTNADGDGVGYAKPSGTPYNCTQPNAYIQLSGTSGIPFAHDEVGEDSADHYDFWGGDNGFGYGMRSVNRLYNNATCVARSATPLVLLPTIAEAQLNAGMESTANFNVRVECSNSVQSGISDTQTALGIQVSEGAYTAAQKLGIINSNGGVSALVSDNYDAAEMAKGVGIYISNSAQPDTEMTLVGQPGIAKLPPGGNAAGWYPVFEGATLEGATHPGYSGYSYSFIARLKKLPNQTVSAGKVRATAYILVKMQ